MKDTRAQILAYAVGGLRARHIAIKMSISRQRVSQILKGEGVRSDTRPVPQGRKRTRLTEDQLESRRAEFKRRRVERMYREINKRALRQGFQCACAIAESKRRYTSKGRPCTNKEFARGLILGQLYLSITGD